MHVFLVSRKHTIVFFFSFRVTVNCEPQLITELVRGGGTKHEIGLNLGVA